MNKTPNLQQDGGSPPIRVARVVNEILKGHLNNVLNVTITANVAATTITDTRLGSDSVLLLMPLTAHAAVEIGNGTLYISSQGTGKAVLTHANSAEVDRSYRAAIVGA